MRIETSQNDKFCYLMLLCLAIIKSTQNFANSTNNGNTNLQNQYPFFIDIYEAYKNVAK